MRTTARGMMCFDSVRHFYSRASEIIWSKIWEHKNGEYTTNDLTNLPAAREDCLNAISTFDVGQSRGIGAETNNPAKKISNGSL